MRRDVFDEMAVHQMGGILPRELDVRPRPGEPSRRRGPRNRPLYRLWEYATWRVRMRAWCNEIKSALLKDEHHPARPQTYKVVQAMGSPLDSPSTWLKWWEGEAIPRPSNIKRADKLAPRAGELLDINGRRTALCRHLFALDVLNARFRTIGDPQEFRRTQAERLIAGINEAWSSFLDTSIPRRKPCDILNELGRPADYLFTNYDIPAVRKDWANRTGGNFARRALPSAAVLQHSWLEPLSIFRFLAMLATWEPLEDPKVTEIWALDLASATLMIRSLVENAGLRRPRFPTIRMGLAGGLHILSSTAFFGPRYLLHQPEMLNIARNAYGDEAEIALKKLCVAQDGYYTAFARLGLPEKALRALNGTHWDKTWDGAFEAARAKI